ncbi:MAG: biopolymer transport protein ExbD [Chitinophagales bacterium]|jgi:biopolymer transport protein ExbD|tara:strand:- start:2258 stop:2668 length:411 start_codon:yes stop_codon:yes gene_type:complete
MRNSLVRKAAEEQGQQIDLTPMLDVVFIMLIFFIVTATFIKEAGVDVNRPVAETRDEVKNQNILVAVTATDEIWINKVLVKPTSVKAIIERMHADNPKGAVVIQADQQSTAEKFAIVYDAARDAGVSNIHLAAEEK